MGQRRNQVRGLPEGKRGSPYFPLGPPAAFHVFALSHNIGRRHFCPDEERPEVNATCPTQLLHQEGNADKSNQPARELC